MHPPKAEFEGSGAEAIAGSSRHLGASENLTQSLREIKSAIISGRMSASEGEDFFKALAELFEDNEEFDKMQLAERDQARASLLLDENLDNPGSSAGGVETSIMDKHTQPTTQEVTTKNS